MSLRHNFPLVAIIVVIYALILNVFLTAIVHSDIDAAIEITLLFAVIGVLFGASISRR